jgi:hypothetical protein
MTTDDVRDGGGVAAGESSDAQPMAQSGLEGLLTGPLGGGAWSSAWSVPVGLAWQEVVANYQQGWSQRHGAAGVWEAAEPGYRFGHEMAADPAFRGRAWSEVEPELRDRYGFWAQERGYPYDDGGWEETARHAHEAWQATGSEPQTG